jgi:hypothetical protein
MRDLIRCVPFDLRVQGGDYEDKPSRFTIPKMFVRDCGIHTTELVRRIREIPE